MKHYVMGLVFNMTRTRVLLTQKLRPDWMAGHWNGIGGKIEDGETPLEAMNRESEEEIGHNYGWQHKITFTCPGGTVFVFMAVNNGSGIMYEQIKDEKLMVWHTYALPDKLMNNLKWIIPLCLSSVRFPVMIDQTELGVID